MVRKCFICGAKQDKKSDVDLSFHSFPTDKEKRWLWIKACKLEDKLDNEQTRKNLNNLLVCSKHFLIDDFDSNWPIRRLQKTAVPAPSNDYFKTKHNEQVSTIVTCVPKEEKIEICLNNVKYEQSEDKLTNNNFPCMSFPDPPLSPRYIGDLQPAHFNTLDKTKRRIAMIKSIVLEKDKKIKRIQQENSRLKKRIVCFKKLLKSLKEHELTEDEEGTDNT